MRRTQQKIAYYLVVDVCKVLQWTDRHTRLDKPASVKKPTSRECGHSQIGAQCYILLFSKRLL